MRTPIYFGYNDRILDIDKQNHSSICKVLDSLVVLEVAV